MFPNSEHRFCVRHMYNNFKSEHKGLLCKQILWAIAKCKTEQGFAQAIEKMRSKGVAVYELLVEKDPTTGQRHTSRTHQYVTCYAITYVKHSTRQFYKHVITLMEMIKNYLMKRLVKKRVEVEKWNNNIWPNVFKVVERLMLESSICHPKYSGNFHYQMRGIRDDQHIVNIDKKTCACNRWQLIGIPCIHGILALLSSNRDPIDYIHNKYKKENFIKALH
ncbi:hypothetical protein LWI28_008209 [Acer negundo]|uniref:SWIM-type domain-containing protein n=1 Tax=Acer negundo TaxID=4023 RepID=A0AAD5NV51_ACENE|nr:hypothetical protein LWI28_008209 [Acer negundo]